MRQNEDLIFDDIEQDLQVFFTPVRPNPIFVNKVKKNLVRQPYTFLEPLRQRFNHLPVIVVVAAVALIFILFRSRNLKI